MKNADLQSLSDDELHSQTLLAARNEKRATLAVLEHLAEADDRRLYAKRGYSSLWEYACKALGYSEPQSSERINSMRLMLRLPEVRRDLETEKTTLTALSKVASHVKREKLSIAETSNLLQQVSGKSTREVERILVSESTEVSRRDRLRCITPEVTRITVEVDAEFMEVMQRFKELKGNLSLAPQEIFRLAMDEFVRKRELKRVSKMGISSNALRAPEAGRAKSPLSVSGPGRRRYVPVQIKAQIRKRSGDRCEFVDLISNRRCESKTGLQFDHRIPFALGDESTLENLRHFCPAHNRLAAIQVFGLTKMNSFMRRKSSSE